jgi:glycosyltransferase involved in cell wall biosynthesis
MKSVLAQKINDDSKITIIENWADLENIKPETYIENNLVKQNNLQGKINFLFAGNLGRLQGLDFLFEIISSVKNSKVHFSFIGNGALLSELKETVQKRELKNVSFLGTFPRNEQNTFLNACHFGMVTLAQEIYGLGVPSKSYNILAAGKPIFFIGNKKSEIASMITDYGCGVAFEFKDKDRIIDFFNRIDEQSMASFEEMGSSARKTAIEYYAKNAILDKFKKEILDGN